jgi:predicted ATP-binding protein involved in virulence
MMKLKKLTLANFRGFDQIEVDFDDEVTVIAGVNGVGKTGLLVALTNAMSLAMPKFTASQEPPISLSDTDVQYEKQALSTSVTLQLHASKVVIDVIRSRPLSDDQAKVLITRRDSLRFSTREAKKGSKEEQRINDEIRLIDVQLSGAADSATVRMLPNEGIAPANKLNRDTKGDGAQPLAVFYSTARLLSRLPPVLRRAVIADASSAHVKSLSLVEVSLNDFANWFRVVVADRNTAARDRLLQQLEKTILAFLPDVSSLTLAETRPPKFSVKKNNKALFLEQLSDGERGMLALVFDLTRRLALANPESEDPIAEGVALVLIDEIELHLHPSWQRRVLRSLKSTFQRCQFVVTTHSPQVIGQVRPKQLRLLHPDQAGRVTVTGAAQSFGMDSSWILQNIMGVPARDLETERRLSLIYQAIDEDNLAAARSRATELRSEIGDFPDLQEALALLDRLALLGSE